jgi:hypothetical protein
MPYPTSSSTVRAHGGQPRRSSGSDTFSRRVLADLDWWRVHGAQTPPTGSDALTERDENGLEQSMGALHERQTSTMVNMMPGVGWNGLALLNDVEVDTLTINWSAYEQQVHAISPVSSCPR